MAIDERKLDIWFEYHPPRDDQIERMQRIRKAAKHFAKAILDNTPTSSDQSSAVRHVRLAVMTSNASIVCGDI